MSWGKSSTENNFEKIGKRDRGYEDDRKKSDKGRSNQRDAARKGKAWTRGMGG